MKNIVTVKVNEKTTCDVSNEFQLAIEELEKNLEFEFSENKLKERSLDLDLFTTAIYFTNVNFLLLASLFRDNKINNLGICEGIREYNYDLVEENLELFYSGLSSDKEFAKDYNIRIELLASTEILTEMMVDSLAKNIIYLTPDVTGMESRVIH